MNVAKLKGCKRCGGDLFMEKDADGVTITCLQCSAVFYHPLPPLPKNKEKKILAR